MFIKKKPFETVEYIIAGLGNPGKKYAGTKHNCGFMALDMVAEELNVKIKKVRFNSLCASYKNIMLVKPQTFMNLSGGAVREAAKALSVNPSNIIVIYDDMAIERGRIRIRKSGSDGGHNGMKDIISKLGTEDFPRIRIGIGHAEIGMVDYVLSPADKESEKGVALAANAALAIIRHGIDYAMNEYNKKE